MTFASSGSMVANGKLAGLPRWHLVIDWNRVDLPTLARPTWEHLLAFGPVALRGCPTYDTALQVVSRSTQVDLFFFDSFLRRHLFLLGVCSSLKRCDEDSR